MVCEAGNLRVPVGGLHALVILFIGFGVSAHFTGGSNVAVFELVPWTR